MMLSRQEIEAIHARAERLAFICAHKQTKLGLRAKYPDTYFYPDIYFCTRCFNAWPPVKIEKLGGRRDMAVIGKRNLRGITHMLKQGDRVLEVLDNNVTYLLPALTFDIDGMIHNTFECDCSNQFCDCGRRLHITPTHDGFSYVCHCCDGDKVRWIK